MSDFFEVDRLVEEHAKLFSTACATTWFKIEKKKPNLEEYRSKVVEFMKHFEYTLSTFPDKPEANAFKEHARSAMQTAIANVLSGENPEVEKRYKYFVEYA